MEKILVTGAAGFIGFHLSQSLTDKGYEVFGIDTVNNYYDVDLKMDRLKILKNINTFRFEAMSICDKDSLDELFAREKFTCVINLAAQAGVRYSIDKPYKYIDANLIGFINILEACRNYPVKHLIFASSSSVYGANTEIPFSTSQSTDHPLSLYAATKKANEMMAHSYAAMYKIPCTGLRFFTVYGPWGRPDMAYFSFTKNILANEPIKIFNEGNMMRDFTYIDDITAAIALLVNHQPGSRNQSDLPEGAKLSSAESYAPYHIYNIGNNSPVSIMEFIETLEKAIGKEAIKEYHPMQKGDMQKTYADIDDLYGAIGYKPETSIEYGLTQFVSWYKKYYNV
ncbi:MAG: capsular biosynthesis protein CpsI [Segetibacter sp.]|nr:capsular biosynthesis protein CpsI [Segetibacter sp.]